MRVPCEMYIGKCILKLANQRYEQCEQLDSRGGGALSQGAGHDGSFYRYAVYIRAKQAVQLTKKPSETADKFIDAHQQHVPTRINVLFLFINFRVPHIKY